jgi:hypothetical protein
MVGLRKNSLMKKYLSRFGLVLLSICMSHLGFAYPEFIGFGYTGCATCHFNGAGNGALNDYGRGLFAAEIAAKPFWNSQKSDEELSASSGFMGSVELPFWFRPSIKSRALTVEKNPGSQAQKIKKFYQMQQDVNIHIPFNQDQTFLFALNMGTVLKESVAAPSKTLTHDPDPLFMTREYYLRGQLFETFWVYLGFMDKVYGIRHADHTAINRSMLGVGQNDQVHGMVLHFAGEKSEFFLNPFAGNLFLEKEKRFTGASVHYEYEPAEQWRVGLSYLRDADTSLIEKNNLAFILKRGLSGGHSLLTELGYRNGLSASKVATTSSYMWTQASIKMRRGFFLQSIMEYFKSDISKLGSENLRWGLGFLVFPIQRLELRLTGVTSRTVDPKLIVKDVWTVQSQLHFSF